MNTLLVLVATAALGIEVGWEPLPGGGHEYTLQIEPQLLRVLEDGQEEIFSEVPAGVEIRRYRVVVGVGKLRRDYGPLAAEIEPPPASLPTRGSQPSDSAAPPTSPLGQSPSAAAPGSAFPAETPDAAQAATAPIESQPATGLESIPPAAEAAREPDFGLPSMEPSEPVERPGEPSAASQPPVESAPPLADRWPNTAEPSLPDGQAEPVTVGNSQSGEPAAAPAKLPEVNDPSDPIRPATFEDGKRDAASKLVDTGKPELPISEPKEQPWVPLVVTIILLACSVGGNIFLGWIAADARARYRNVVSSLAVERQ